LASACCLLSNFTMFSGFILGGMTGPAGAGTRFRLGYLFLLLRHGFYSVGEPYLLVSLYLLDDRLKRSETSKEAICLDLSSSILSFVFMTLTVSPRKISPISISLTILVISAPCVFESL